MKDVNVVDELLQSAVRTLRGSYAALPTGADMDTLIRDSRSAEARGYYDPIEDERLREAYSRYLGIRVAIWQTCLLYTSDACRRYSLCRSRWSPYH